MFPLSGIPLGFDLNNAYACALACQQTYLAPELIPGKVIDDWKLPHYRRLDFDNAQGFVAANDDVTLLAFRGTEQEFNDWYYNLDTEFVPGPLDRSERVHRGFFAGLRPALPKIEQIIDTISAPNAPLIITGHSLGGALATLSAASFYRRQRPVHSVYTFGSPRVGDKRFRNEYESDRFDFGRTFRVVNRHDVVTRVPPRLLRYRHVGRLRYLDQEGKMHEDLTFWDRLLLAMDPKGREAKQYVSELIGKLPGAFEDHKVGEYVRKLEALTS